MPNQRPFVLVLAGLDSSGGSGLQADILTLNALRCHALPVASCLTVQSADRCHAVTPIDAAQVMAQVETISAQLPIAAVKMGTLGSAAVAEAMADWLNQHRVPLVLDPVLQAGGGGDLAVDDLTEFILSRLIPLTTVITPNGPELEVLGGLSTPIANAQALIARGCRAVLRTGGHDDGAMLINTLHTAAGNRSWRMARLPGVFRGTGCTLASAVAAGLAHRLPLEASIEQAQDFVHAGLRAAYPLGNHRHVPRRDRESE